MTEAEANLLRALRDDAILAVELLRHFGDHAPYTSRSIYAAQVAELLQLRIDQVSARLRDAASDDEEVTM